MYNSDLNVKRSLTNCFIIFYSIKQTKIYKKLKSNLFYLIKIFNQTYLSHILCYFIIFPAYSIS